MLISGDLGGTIRLKQDLLGSSESINNRIKNMVDLGIQYMMNYIIWSERIERAPGESTIIYSWPESLDEIKRLESKLNS